MRSMKKISLNGFLLGAKSFLMYTEDTRLVYEVTMFVLVKLRRQKENDANCKGIGQEC